MSEIGNITLTLFPSLSFPTFIYLFSILKQQIFIISVFEGQEPSWEVLTQVSHEVAIEMSRIHSYVKDNSTYKGNFSLQSTYIFFTLVILKVTITIIKQ